MATYLSLIEKSIRGFNNVWDALVEKQGILTEAQIAGTSLVDVENYGTLTNKLVSLRKSDGSLFDGSALNTINYFEATETKTITKSTTNPIVKTTGGYDLKFSIGTAGYYSVGTSLTASLEAQKVTFAKGATGVTYTEATSEGTLGYYTVALDNKLLDSVTVAEGNVVAAFDETSGMSASELKTQITSVEGSSTGVSLTKLNSSDATAENAYYIDVTTAAAASGTINATSTTTVTTGYVEGKTLTATDSFTVDPTAIKDSITTRFAIPMGSVKVDSAANSDAKADITSSNASIFSETATGISLKASVSGIELVGTFTEGYVKSGDTLKIGKVEVPDSETLYIKEGTAPDQEIALTPVEDITTAVTDNLDILGAGGAEITVTVDKTVDKTFTEGYVSSAGDITVSGTQKINIKKASGVSTTAAITGYEVGGDKSIMDDAGTYSITITPTVETGKSLTGAGLVLGSGDFSISNTTQDANKDITLNFAAGSVTLNDIGFAMSGTIQDKDGINDTVQLGDLFKSAAPTDRDYFILKTSASLSTTAGFIGTTAATDANNHKELQHYIPKAKIEWIKDEDSTEEYIHVAEAGYLPSGVLTEISTVAPSAAEVTLKAESSGIALVTATQTGKNYQTITISKNGVDAGYISDTKGTLKNTTYYVEKGSVSGTPSATVTGTGIAANDEGGYTVSLAANITHGITVAPGYITADEVNIGTAATQIGTYKLNKATFTTATHTTNVATTSTNVAADAARTSKYVIVPSIESCSSTFQVGQEGYITEADNAGLKFEFNEGHAVSNLEASKFYVKAGSATGTDATNGYTISALSNTLAPDVLSGGLITATNTGAYTITVSGNVASQVVIDEGYYGQSEKTVKGTLAVSKALTIAHGAVSGAVDNSSANAITSNDAANPVSLYTEAQKTADTDNSYAVINAKATVVSKTTVTEGYVKESDITEAAARDLTAAAYVKLYKTASTTTSGATDASNPNWSVTVGQTSDVLPSADPSANEYVVLDMDNRYSTKDTTVTLTDHAMGKEVVKQLRALESRLLGNLS